MANRVGLGLGEAASGSAASGINVNNAGVTLEQGQTVKCTPTETVLRKEYYLGAEQTLGFNGTASQNVSTIWSATEGSPDLPTCMPNRLNIIDVDASEVSSPLYMGGQWRKNAPDPNVDLFYTPNDDDVGENFSSFYRPPNGGSDSRPLNLEADQLQGVQTDAQAANKSKSLDIETKAKFSGQGGDLATSAETPATVRVNSSIYPSITVVSKSFGQIQVTPTTPSVLWAKENNSSIITLRVTPRDSGFDPSKKEEIYVLSGARKDEIETKECAEDSCSINWSTFSSSVTGVCEKGCTEHADPYEQNKSQEKIEGDPNLPNELNLSGTVNSGEEDSAHLSFGQDLANTTESDSNQLETASASSLNPNISGEESLKTVGDGQNFYLDPNENSGAVTIPSADENFSPTPNDDDAQVLSDSQNQGVEESDSTSLNSVSYTGGASEILETLPSSLESEVNPDNQVSDLSNCQAEGENFEGSSSPQAEAGVDPTVVTESSSETSAKSKSPNYRFKTRGSRENLYINDDGSGFAIECLANAKKKIQACHVLEPGLSEEELRKYFDDVIWQPYPEYRQMTSKREFAFEICKILYEQGRLPKPEVFEGFLDNQKDSHTWRVTGERVNKKGEVIDERKYCPMVENFLRKQGWIDWLESNDLHNQMLRKRRQSQDLISYQQDLAAAKAYIADVERKKYIKKNEVRVEAMANTLEKYFSFSKGSFVRQIGAMRKTCTLDQMEQVVEDLVQSQRKCKAYHFLNQWEKLALKYEAKEPLEEVREDDGRLHFENIGIDEAFDMFKWARVLGTAFKDHVTELFQTEYGVTLPVAQDMFQYTLSFKGKKEDIPTIQNFVLRNDTVKNREVFEEILISMWKNDRTNCGLSVEDLISDVERRFKEFRPTRG